MYDTINGGQGESLHAIEFAVGARDITIPYRRAGREATTTATPQLAGYSKELHAAIGQRSAELLPHDLGVEPVAFAVVAHVEVELGVHENDAYGEEVGLVALASDAHGGTIEKKSVHTTPSPLRKLVAHANGALREGELATLAGEAAGEEV